MTRKTRVLFLCPHNAARSQMAEALLRQLGGDQFETESAGFEPRPIDPLAVEAMRKIGIDISRAQPKEIFPLYRAGRQYEYVIAMCDEATGERCPIFPGVTQRLHWSFPDPCTFEDPPTERLAQVEALRDEIRARIAAWVETIDHSRDRRPT